MGEPNEPKKETVRITLPPPKESEKPVGPRKPTVRISLPTRPPHNAPLRPVVDPNNRPAPPPLAKPPMPPVSSIKPPAPPKFRPPPIPPRKSAGEAGPSLPPVLPKPPVKPPLPPTLGAPKSAPVADDARTTTRDEKKEPASVESELPAKTPPPVPAKAGIYPGARSSSPGPKQETARISTMSEPPLPPLKPKPAVNMTKTQPLIKAPVSDAPVAAVNIAPTTAPRSSLSSAIEAVPLPLLWALAAVSFVVFLIQLWNYITV